MRGQMHHSGKGKPEECLCISKNSRLVESHGVKWLHLSVSASSAHHHPHHLAHVRHARHQHALPTACRSTFTEEVAFRLELRAVQLLEDTLWPAGISSPWS